MAKQVILTQEELEVLEQELEYLESVERKEVIEEIKVALSFGDLPENSEYDEAKNDQATTEACIADIEVMLKNVVVIDEDELGNKNIHIGSKVGVRITPERRDLSVKEYKIVGSNEANPLQGKISDESVVDKVLLGHDVGDEVGVEISAGIIHYEISTISKWRIPKRMKWRGMGVKIFTLLRFCART